jgi:hypothetical protein
MRMYWHLVNNNNIKGLYMLEEKAFGERAKKSIFLWFGFFSPWYNNFQDSRMVNSL